MKYELEKHILDRTDKCLTNFSCLTGSGGCICKVDRIIDDDILSLKRTTDNVCMYRIAIASLQICTCPARNNIYRHYKE